MRRAQPSCSARWVWEKGQQRVKATENFLNFSISSYRSLSRSARFRCMGPQPVPAQAHQTRLILRSARLCSRMPLQEGGEPAGASFHFCFLSSIACKPKVKRCSRQGARVAELRARCDYVAVGCWDAWMLECCSRSHRQV